MILGSGVGFHTVLKRERRAGNALEWVRWTVPLMGARSSNFQKGVASVSYGGGRSSRAFVGANVGVASSTHDATLLYVVKNSARNGGLILCQIVLRRGWRVGSLSELPQHSFCMAVLYPRATCVTRHNGRKK